MALPTNGAILAALGGPQAQNKPKPKKSIPSSHSILAALPGSPQADFSRLTMNQTMGEKRFADFAPPHPEEIPKQIEEGIKRIALYDPNGFLVPKKLQQRFLPDTELTRGEPDITQQIVAKLPEGVQRLAESFLRDLRGGPIATLLPVLARDTNEKVRLASGRLEDLGVEPERAASLGFYSVFSQGNYVKGTPEDQRKQNALKELAKLNPTEEETRSLGNTAWRQYLGEGVDIFGNLPFAALEKQGLARAIQLAQSGHSAEVVPKIFEVLRGAGIAEDLAKTYAPIFAKADFPIIEKGLANLEKMQNTTRATERIDQSLAKEGRSTSWPGNKTSFQNLGSKGLSEPSGLTREIDVGISNLSEPAAYFKRNISPSSSLMNRSKEGIDAHISTVRASALANKPLSVEDAATRYWDEVIAPKMGKEPIVLAGDDMKKYFGKDYDPARSDMYAKANYRNVQRAIKESPGDFAMLGGGPGSGKTEFLTKSILDKGFDGVLYDTTLSNLKGVSRIIEEARAAGKQIQIYGIVTDLDRARRFTIAREAKTQRAVTDEAFARGHAGFADVVRELLERGIITSDEIQLYDMRFAKTKADAMQIVRMGISAKKPLDLIKKVQYSETDIIKQYGRGKYIQETERGYANARSRSEPHRPPRGDRADRGQRVANVDTGAEARVGEHELGQGSKSSGVTPSLNVNVVKSIAAETKSIAIANILSDQFPKITKRTLDVFGRRLAHLKREADIQGVLSMLQRLANQTDEAGQKTLDATMPSSMRDALSPRKAQIAIEHLTRQIKTPENAAIAEREYNRLWSEFDQRVIDRFNEANIQRGILEEIIADHPAKLFTKFRLPGQSWQDFSLEEALMRGMKTGGKNKNIDYYVSEQGYEDLAAAQKGLDDYLAIRQQLRDVVDEVKELSPKVKNAKVVRDLLDEMPVVPNARIGGIDSLANTADVRGTYRDISGFSGGFRDMYRNFERFFGSRFPDVKKAVLDPFDAAKGKYVDEYNKLGDEIGEAIVEGFKIKRGSPESRAVMDWGELKHGDDVGLIQDMQEKLVAEFGDARFNEIDQATEWFRQEYNRLIDEVNEVRKKIYPNNPSKLIAYRKDYFRHFQEIGDGMMDAVRSFMDVPSGIDPKLVGISEFTKPKSKWLSFAQKRLGFISERDAVGGFLDYAPAFAYAKHIDPQIGVFRYLRRRLSEVAPVSGTATKEGDKLYGIDNFLQFLDDFGNNLATKTNPVDRWVQKRMPGGRRTMRALDWLNNRIKANTILGNLGSSLAQMANIPAGIASAKQYSAHGFSKTLGSIMYKNEAAAKSTFLKERYLESLKDRFPRDFWTRPVKAGTEAAARKAAMLLRVGDMIGTHFIWNAHYAKALAEKMADPVTYADDVTRKLVAGRGIGELPIDQQSKMFQFFAPFQVEVGNLWHVMHDMVSARDLAGLSVLLFANYLFNEAAERTRGSRVVFDPVNSLIEGGMTFAREFEAGHTHLAFKKGIGRQAGEALSNVPLGQSFTAALPDELFGIKKEELFGEGDPNRFGPPLLFATALADAPFRIGPAFGGLQIRKTWKGIRALLDEQATTKAGKSSFPIAWTPQNVVRSVMFGPNAVSEARTSFAKGDDLRQRLATQDSDREQALKDAEDKWQELKNTKEKKGVEAAKTEWNTLKETDPALFKRVNKIADDEGKGIMANDRLILMLGVENGERARYVVDQLNSLKTKEEKQALWRDYTKKKILTKEVQKQVDLLMQQ